MFGIMFLILMVLAILSLIIAICLFNRNKEDAEVVFGVFIGLLLSFLISFIIVPIKESIPAIEVYRGNTTLQITYQDSIPVDSVVVYKNK